ncbi:hypothetical protein [Paracoccus sp. S1E-3]|uniref:hypothetical protein n=1 Tax=Paracoccus sp. S1E-3 TaxID=2756130 RepID=UPI0015EEE06A|nr:hypothetical protein [Paracoccus sp. S1E-3]MBA4490813.1 hypothetical protein [Paracoccus sp. S1E-3]
MSAGGSHDGCYFFFLRKRHSNNLPHFEDRFGLTITPTTFEVMDDAHQEILFSNSHLAELTSFLDASPDSHFNLYLQDSRAQSFLFCHRPEDHHVLGIPYELLNDAKLLSAAKRLGAILGWGFHDAPPFDQIGEMRHTANAAHSIFRRYRKGQLIAAD